MSSSTAQPAGGPELPALLPRTLLEDDVRDGWRIRRTPRDWLVDVLCVLGAFVFGLLILLIEIEAVSPQPPNEPTGAQVIDFLIGVGACLLLWGRRRWPVAIALIVTVLGCVSLMSGVASAVAMVTVTVHRRPIVSLPIAVLGGASTAVYYAWRPDPSLTYPQAVIFGCLIVTVIYAWAMFVRARRQLVLSLRDRAQRAEAEQQLRVAQARQLERARIAREMHDVLAHRISLLSLHAGALEFRPDAPPAEIAAAAAVIRENAHQALTDLREVIGVLRDDAQHTDVPPPQPALAALPALIEESRAAGVRVRLSQRLDDLAAPPAGIGRSAYRIVQEGLTNARKHAQGATVSVDVHGDPAAGLTVQVSNLAPVQPARAGQIPGAGTGIIGLTERVDLAGGRLEHGRTDDGAFVLRAWLPWQS
jgi:signal transduction histidine kinase